MGFAHAARDQLGDLGAEVDDGDLLVLHGLIGKSMQEKRKGRPDWTAPGAFFRPGQSAR